MTRPPHASAPSEPVDVADFLTAIPALLGFVPERSLILVAVVDRTVHSVMRYDLSLTVSGIPDDDLLDVLHRLGVIIERRGLVSPPRGGVVGIIADDRYRPDDPRYRRIMAIADRRCGGSGGVVQGFVVAEFERDAPWRLIWQPRSGGPTTAGVRGKSAGTLHDPRTCAAAVATAVDTGRLLLARRSQMAEMLSPLPHCADDDSGRCTQGRGLMADSGMTGDDEQASLLAELLDVMRGRLSKPDCATMTRLERAILAIPVRDAALACAVSDLRPGAHALWRMLTRRLRGRGRASAATLLAHLHYIGGEGAYAGVALDCALAAAPDWNLACLLDRALRGGLEPALLWEMVEDSYQAATRLGVDLPRATLRAVG